jgi:hypothetical protein
VKALARTLPRPEPIGGLFSWWLTELQELLPPRWRERGPRRSALELRLERPFVRVQARRGQRLEPLGSFLLPAETTGALHAEAGVVIEPPLRRALERHKASTVLVLGEQDALTCIDVLPASAENELARIMAHKLDLLTPWPADQVHAAQRVAARRPDGMLEVLVAAAPRATVDEVQRRLALAGVSVTGVDVALDQATSAGVDLLRAETPPRRGSRLARGLLALLVGALLAGGGWAGWQIWQRHRLIAGQTELLQNMERRLADLPELRARIDAMQEEASFLVNDRRSRPSPLIVLEVLSRLLPDTVWLTDIQLENRELVITGMAEDASALIPLVEGAPEFERARFQLPSTRVRVRTPDDGEREVERFALSALVDPGVEPDL